MYPNYDWWHMYAAEAILLIKGSAYLQVYKTAHVAEEKQTKNCPKNNIEIGLYQNVGIYCNDPKISDRHVWANSVDPDQTARAAVSLGSTTFAILTACFGHVALWENQIVQIL